MKKTLFLLFLALLFSQVSSAQTVFTGYCLPTTPDNTSTTGILANFGNPTSNPICWSGSHLNDNGVPMASAGKLKHLFVTGKYIDTGTAPASWNMQVQLFVNGVAQSLSCSTTLTGGTSVPATISCSDVTHEILVALGDVISVQMSTSGLSCTLASCPSLGLNVSLKEIPN